MMLMVVAVLAMIMMTIPSKAHTHTTNEANESWKHANRRAVWGRAINYEHHIPPLEGFTLSLGMRSHKLRREDVLGMFAP